MSADILLVIAAIAALFLGYPVALTLAGVAVLFGLVGILLNVFDAALFMAIPPRLFAILTSDILLAIPLFILMGKLLEKSGLAEQMFASLARHLSHRRGGLPLSVIVIGALMAASTGIVGASVVTLGLLALPPLLKSGIAPSRAGGIVAAAGTLGQIIPPSIVLIVLGDQISNAYQQMQNDAGRFASQTVTVSDLFAAAIIPGLLLVAFYALYQFFTSPPLEASYETKVEYADDKPASLFSLLAPVFLIIPVLGSILAGVATPSEAASIGVLGTLMLIAVQSSFQQTSRVGAKSCLGALLASITLFAISWAMLEPGLAKTAINIAAWTVVILIAASAVASLFRQTRLQDILGESVHLTCMIFLIVIGASIFSLVFRGLGGDETIAGLITGLPGGTYGALFTVMLVLFLLGFFLEFLEITYVVVPLVAPVLLAMPMADGTPMNPLWLAVLIAIMLQTSFLTPPMGVSLFYLRSVAPKTISTGSLYRGVAPFVVLQILALLVVTIFPFLATALPELLFER